MSKPVVAIVFGGRSSEHEISCSTAGGVLAAIDRDRFDVIPIGITRDGAFTLQPDDPARFTMNPEAMPQVHDNGTRVLWPDSATTRELRVVEADGAPEEPREREEKERCPAGQEKLRGRPHRGTPRARRVAFRACIHPRPS